MIPLYILEEHHEAFIAWNHAIKNEWIPAKDNHLFHVDEHSDMATPRFNDSIHSLGNAEGLEHIRDFTYRELNIASFIMPACYQRIIKKVYFIFTREFKSKRQVIASY